MKEYRFVIILLLLSLTSFSITAQFFLDVESGAAFTVYNDVKIPSDTGTEFSLADETSSDPVLAVRFRIGYTFFNNHTISLLAAPLVVEGTGIIDEDVTFMDKTFSAGTELTSRYRFDSYRFTYRWDYISKEYLTSGVGLTVKVRSADIALMDSTGYVHREDLGVVPLINFRTEWFFTEIYGVLLDGDALVTPFGRAEDINIALLYRYKPDATFRLGYRVLEGGSDGGGNVYTFSMFNYLSAGVSVLF